MVNLTFGEQVKIILSRKGMTIKELAEKVEQRTGKNMSRQNMTQRLGRDNFQEQDMRLIADILGCSFQLSIMEPADVPEVEVVAEVPAASVAPVEAPVVQPESEEVVESTSPTERDITVGELVQLSEEVAPKKEEQGIRAHKRMIVAGRNFVRAKKETPSQEEETIIGERNPYTGKEYQTNSVRMHPKRIGYVQVYDQEQHTWTDMTEWAFLGYQERKKKLLGKDYEPPIYLD